MHLSPIFSIFFLPTPFIFFTTRVPIKTRLFHTTATYCCAQKQCMPAAEQLFRGYSRANFYTHCRIFFPPFRTLYNIISVGRISLPKYYRIYTGGNNIIYLACVCAVWPVCVRLLHIIRKKYARRVAQFQLK